jgi:hypothetical protein
MTGATTTLTLSDQEIGELLSLITNASKALEFFAERLQEESS